MNLIYPKYKEAILQAAPNSSLAGTVKAYLADTGNYTYNGAHQFLTDLPLIARVGSAVTLASKTFVNGVFDAADISFLTVAGPNVEALILAIDTGVDATSRLVAYIDSAQGLPFSPSGVDQPVVWSASGIFAL
jgi:hypothetical protein